MRMAEHMRPEELAAYYEAVRAHLREREQLTLPLDAESRQMVLAFSRQWLERQQQTQLEGMRQADGQVTYGLTPQDLQDSITDAQKYGGLRATEDLGVSLSEAVRQSQPLTEQESERFGQLLDRGQTRGLTDPERQEYDGLAERLWALTQRVDAQQPEGQTQTQTQKQGIRY